MKRKLPIATGLLFVAGCCLLSAQGQGKDSDPLRARVVRIAQLEIDIHQLTAYQAALKKEIEASVRLEPGVLALYAVAVKGHPEQIRLFEMYSSPAAYEAHLHTPHFLQYKTGTQGMVKALKLIETDPLLLGSK